MWMAFIPSSSNFGRAMKAMDSKNSSNAVGCDSFFVSAAHCSRYALGMLAELSGT